ncbi:MAG: CDP-diacylglycerol--glycerol-3-phosphate 3-phosphatidyltransferase [Spirochaetia bacterium]|nr:CDP-diacylglycerol--glycerol-3-phosphate 3-phosphatidyltransferase [Spirochaetia bacterium]
MLKLEWNLPNILTILRVIIVPFFIYLLFDKTFSGRLTALILFTIASITDLFDGYLARKWKQETEFGKFLDPLADKALVLGGFITFIFISDQIQIWMVLCIIGRDLLITMLRSIAIRQGRSIRTSMFGKLKTVFQMFSIGLIIISFLMISYKERNVINELYHQAYLNGIDPWFVAFDNAIAFFQGTYKSVPYALASFVPYYLMLLTTLLTIVSGLRYLITNYELLLPKNLISKKSNGS